MPHQPTLPPDSELSKLIAKGLTDSEIAARYGVTKQAVNLRLQAMGMPRRPFVTDANAIIGKVWKIKATKEPGSHHQTGPAQSLKAWVRLRLGDPSLSPRQHRAATNFELRIRRDDVVLCYDPDSVKGFYYVPRGPDDGLLVVRWPALEDGQERDFRAVAVLSLTPRPDA